MTVALSVFQVQNSIEDSTESVLLQMEAAGRHGADLVAFPETCLTGLVNNGVPERDRTFAIHRDFGILAAIRERAVKTKIAVGTGFLEASDDQLFDTYLIAGLSGNASVLYRRRSRGWLTRSSDPSVYGLGNAPAYLRLKDYECTVLICGDLFDEPRIADVRGLGTIDFVLNPLVRHEVNEQLSQTGWSAVLDEYRGQLKLLGAAGAIVNLVGTDLNGYTAFGGAAVFDGLGNIVASRDPYQPGVLYVEI